MARGAGLLVLVMALLGVVLLGREGLLTLVNSSFAVVQQRKSRPQLILQLGDCAASNRTGVLRSPTNVFSLDGSWTANATLAAWLDEQDQPYGCRKPPLPYPFGTETHGCCSTKPSPQRYLDRAFVVAASSECNALHASRPSSFAIQAFLLAARDKTVLFLGDSITLLSFAALAMQLKANQIKYRLTVTNLQRQRLFVASTNTTVLLLELYEFQEFNRTGLDNGNDTDPFEPAHHVWDDELVRYLQPADVVITNFGLHWGIAEYHYRHYRHVWDHIQKQQQQQQHPMCLVLRRTLPQHFATYAGNGRYCDRIRPDFASYGCVPLNTTWTHPSDDALLRFQHELETEQTSTTTRMSIRVATMDMTSLMAEASDFHSLKAGDCSHLCYSPLIWTPMIYLTAETMRLACEER